MKERKIKFIYCPICKRDIETNDCFMISFFVEGLVPSVDLPDYIAPDDAEQKTEECMKCKWHPY